MRVWRTAGHVGAGALVTLVAGGATVLLLPLIGLGTAAIVGSWLPPWVLGLPLALCGVVGGGTAASLQGGDRNESALVGGLAAALGGAVVGAALGFVALVLIVKMTPAAGTLVNYSETTLAMVAVGGGSGFVAGGVLGAVGGVGAYIRRTP